MKITTTIALLAATTLVGQSAITLHNLAGSQNNQANFADVAGITFSTGTLGADINLASIDLAGRSAGASLDLISFAIYADTDNNATTFDLGAFLGTSAESQALATGTNNYTFSGITLADNTVYTLVLVNDTVASGAVGYGLVDGSTDAGTTMFQNGGTAAFAASHEAAISVNLDSVPEPSSTALLGLGSLALILRRKK